MQRMRTRNLVGQTGNVGRVVVAMTRLVVSVCEDGQVALRVRRSQLRFRASIVECLPASVDFEINIFVLGTT